MRLIDEIAILADKISQIEDDTQPTSHVDIIESAFWARSILTILEGVDFSQYGHHLKTNIRTARSIDDPDHPGFAKIVYAHNENISLKSLLGMIVHFRYFIVNTHADGNSSLTVMSDRNSCVIFYSDFLDALKSLIISEHRTVLAVCDLSERYLREMCAKLASGVDVDHNGSDVFHLINLFWLSHDFLWEDHTLKRRIMATIFGITDVPDHALSDLRFFQSKIGPGYKVVIGFSPNWEEGQEVMSQDFEPTVLFDLIRDSYK